MKWNPNCSERYDRAPPDCFSIRGIDPCSRMTPSVERASYSYRGAMLGTSPGDITKPRPGSIGSSPQFSYLGSSPPSGLGSAGAAARGASGSEKHAPYAAAKKFWKRICFDPTLEPENFAVSPHRLHASCK